VKTARPGSGLRRLQLRITAVAMLAIVLFVVVAGLVLVRLFRQELVRQVDEQLVATERFVQQSFATDSLPTTATGGASGSAGAEGLYQVVSPEGEVLFASPRLEGEAPIVDPSPEGSAPATVHTDVDGDVRVITLPLDGNVLIFGRSLADADDAVGSLVRILLVGVPLFAVGLGIVVWFTVGRALRPVEAAMRRERQLVADASHELRSPLAGVRVLLESEEDRPGEVRRNRDDALATLSRLDAIIGDLLLLSRNEQAGGDGRALVDLDEAVLRQAHIARRLTDVQVDTSAVSAGQVVGIEQELERAVENLLSNAVRHAESSVEITLNEVDGAVRLSISDDGAGIPEDERDRIFERFTRLDDARSRDHGGTGLGLAIVEEIVQRHGGAVTVDDSASGGATFVVRLPSSVRGPRVGGP
jgi:signal transduction histidine kinase